MKWRVRCLQQHTPFICDAEEKLKAMLPPQRDPLIGWLSIRPGTPLSPSMRESAVTQQMQAYVALEQGRAVPTFLMLLATQPDHQGATITMQYR